jgi:hypothetical protein
VARITRAATGSIGTVRLVIATATGPPAPPLVISEALPPGQAL